MKLFNDEQSQFIKDNSNGNTDLKLCKMVKDKFGVSVTKKQMANWRGNHNARSDISLRGWKKGKKAGIDFKNKRKTSVPIGTEGIAKGIITVKIAENKWIPKQRFLYEQAHGAINKSEVVIFLDGNNRNFDLENLKKVSRRQLAIINRKRMLTGNRELNESVVAYSALISKVSELEHEKNKKTKSR
ncbi:HNH endonuclease [uncultured Enterococcus sp.]|uniref:HNH endonuclease n=1 Tax=uncultured Enterococcus sp. TaxID=167972 RepID=UPI00259743D5|nr:HNH endonuclease [uncultured Enterococcus sp.]